ncbi:hypothetical protein M513_09126 [Trichuris suis]|uniref:Nematode cuticle collagen N-terminal domain-containing protein n=1 Tax=Trichuris suis TaxID=68888 RepID=A0A085LYI7_9BILA|nr:hypothetical protein M513_09126 [Trichuris suis]
MKPLINTTLLFALAIAIAIVGIDAGGRKDTLEVMAGAQEGVREKRGRTSAPIPPRTVITMKPAINITLLFALAIAIAIVGIDAEGLKDTLEAVAENQERVLEKRDTRFRRTPHRGGGWGRPPTSRPLPRPAPRPPPPRPIRYQFAQFRKTLLVRLCIKSQRKGMTTSDRCTMKPAINITLLFALAIAIAIVGIDAEGPKDTLEAVAENQERVLEKRDARFRRTPRRGGSGRPPQVRNLVYRVPRKPPPRLIRRVINMKPAINITLLFALAIAIAIVGIDAAGEEPITLTYTYNICGIEKYSDKDTLDAVAENQERVLEKRNVRIRRMPVRGGNVRHPQPRPRPPPRPAPRPKPSRSGHKDTLEVMAENQERVLQKRQTPHATGPGRRRGPILKPLPPPLPVPRPGPLPLPRPGPLPPPRPGPLPLPRPGPRPLPRPGPRPLPGALPRPVPPRILTATAGKGKSVIIMAIMDRPHPMAMGKDHTADVVSIMVITVHGRSMATSMDHTADTVNIIITMHSRLMATSMDHTAHTVIIMDPMDHRGRMVTSIAGTVHHGVRHIVVTIIINVQAIRPYTSPMKVCHVISANEIIFQEHLLNNVFESKWSELEV